MASLILEDQAASVSDVRAGVSTELKRIQAVVALVTAFGRLAPPSPALVRLSVPVLAAMSRVAATIPLAAHARRLTESEASARVDEPQATAALEAAIAFLASRSATRPVPLRVTIRARAPGSVDIGLRVAGVTVPDESAVAALAAVIDVDERTRESRPGLGLAREIVRAHGGAISWRRPKDAARGTALRLRWPV